MRLAVLILVAAFVLGCGTPARPVSAPSPFLDKPLPALAGPTTNGNELTEASLANKVVVVKFFAKYCEPCKKTLPKAEKLHRSNSDVVFVGVAEDEAKADVDEMIETYDLTFPVIHDPENAVAFRFNPEGP